MSLLSNFLCTDLRGVGPQFAARLEKLNIRTVQDLLFHLPSRYEDRTRITPLLAVKPGDHVVVEGMIKETEVRYHRRRSLLCCLQDASGHTITLRFFYFTKAQQDALSNGNLRLRCFGEVRWGTSGFEMIHPEYRHIRESDPLPVDAHLTPIYPTTEGIQQTGFRKLTDQALTLLEQSKNLEEHIPAEVRENYALTEVTEAIKYVHRPPPDAPKVQLEAGLHPYQQRLAFEELLAHQLSLRRLRANLQQNKASVLVHQVVLTKQFLETLPFSLTAAQRRVFEEISQDIACDCPMLRLVQGDVGSGKTIVAALSVLQAVGNGCQSAVMAPTELLAEQHFKNFNQWLQPFGIKSVFLSGSLKTSERVEILSAIEDGTAQVIIGTHALFQKEVNFHRLALIVIDEQHRFGVHQRLALREKGHKNHIYPHQLIMTATPIPRTLAMTAYADLDCSSIDELPPGRKPVKTILVSNARREEVISRIAQACKLGQQAYWVCTLIEESEVLQCQAAEISAQDLQAHLPELNIALIHGRLKAQEKESIMQKFRAGEINLLVATTVIEVGVDVPNASLMMIENPERLGLAQLHQLRGRVGRGSTESHCVLMYQSPLSFQAKERLWVMKNSQDGFEIAQKDLALRGPGEVLGTRQTGLMQMRIADLLRDKMLLPKVQKVSEKLLTHHPECVDALIKRWVGQGEKYGKA